jgi:hypothetical protein
MAPQHSSWVAADRSVSEERTLTLFWKPEFFFLTETSILVLGAHPASYSVVATGLPQGARRPRSETDLSPPSSAEVKFPIPLWALSRSAHGPAKNVLSVFNLLKPSGNFTYQQV